LPSRTPLFERKRKEKEKKTKGQAQRLTGLEELVNFVGRWGWVGNFIWRPEDDDFKISAGGYRRNSLVSYNSRCVRRAMALSEDGSPGRKDWIDNRLKELDRIFAISVGGFSIVPWCKKMVCRKSKWLKCWADISRGSIDFWLLSRN